MYVPVLLNLSLCTKCTREIIHTENHQILKTFAAKIEKSQMGCLLFELKLNSLIAAACVALRRTQVRRF